MSWQEGGRFEKQLSEAQVNGRGLAARMEKRPFCITIGGMRSRVERNPAVVCISAIVPIHVRQTKDKQWP
jgi:hypothetical protein